MTDSTAGPKGRGAREFPRPGLPRRHRLSPEEVADDQRQRLLEAVAESVSIRGYAATSVEKILALAGVSRGTFYQNFSNRYDCLVAAHEAIFQRFFAVVEAACATRDSWEERVVAVVEAVAGFADDCPQDMRLLTLDTLAADQEAARKVLAGADRLVAMLHAGRRAHPAAAELPPETERLLLGAVSGTINCRLVNGEPLAGIEPQLVELLLTPYLGYEAAVRVASGQRRPLAA